MLGFSDVMGSRSEQDGCCMKTALKVLQGFTSLRGSGWEKCVMGVSPSRRGKTEVLC